MKYSFVFLGNISVYSAHITWKSYYHSILNTLKCIEGVCRWGSVGPWVCCAGLERSNESLQEVCQIEVLQHVNSGSLEVWDIRFGKGFLWSPKPLYPGENWLSGQDTVQRAIASIKREGNILRGRRRNGEKQTLLYVYTAETVHLNNLFALLLGIKILFVMKQVGHCQHDTSTHFMNVLGSRDINQKTALIQDLWSNLNYSDVRRMIGEI